MFGFSWNVVSLIIGKNIILHARYNQPSSNTCYHPTYWSSKYRWGIWSDEKLYIFQCSPNKTNMHKEIRLNETFSFCLKYHLKNKAANCEMLFCFALKLSGVMLDCCSPKSVLKITNSNFVKPVTLRAKIKNGQVLSFSLFKVVSKIFSHMLFSVFFLWLNGFFNTIFEKYIVKMKLLSYNFCMNLSLTLNLLTLNLHLEVKLHFISCFDLILSWCRSFGQLMGSWFFMPYFSIVLNIWLQCAMLMAACWFKEGFYLSLPNTIAENPSLSWM